jgi:hypothetical protein
MKTVKKTMASMPKKSTAKKTTTKSKKFAKGGVKKYQTAGTSKSKTDTPFQKYMKTTPGAQPSDTSQVFTGSRNTDNMPLDQAYYDTFYAGKENSRRTGSDKVMFDPKTGKRVRYKTGGMFKSKPVVKKSAMVVKKAKTVSKKKK